MEPSTALDIVSMSGLLDMMNLFGKKKKESARKAEVKTITCQSTRGDIVPLVVKVADEMGCGRHVVSMKKIFIYNGTRTCVCTVCDYNGCGGSSIVLFGIDGGCNVPCTKSSQNFINRIQSKVASAMSRANIKMTQLVT